MRTERACRFDQQHDLIVTAEAVMRNQRLALCVFGVAYLLPNCATRDVPPERTTWLVDEYGIGYSRDAAIEEGLLVDGNPTSNCRCYEKTIEVHEIACSKMVSSR